MTEVHAVDVDRVTAAADGMARLSDDAPVAVEVRGVRKTFTVPDQKVDSIKERVTHPFSSHEQRVLHALRDVTFDVRRGEFFGIVGRNGSGKSTLLKILASIYAQDAGTVRMAGRVAPFIELGVGFNPELAAADNVILNGVLMGLSRAEARRRLDEVLDFAELREFSDLKLKNYSSGMMVRLAFSIMVQADADIMLVDEVLAVGDASFAQKCMDVFYERKRVGKTIVFVTHDMGAVQALCHRAMLIHDGVVEHLGDPEQTAMHYFRRNFAGTIEADAVHEDASRVPVISGDNASRLSARLRDPDGNQVENLEQGMPIDLEVVLVAGRDLPNPRFVVHIVNEDGVVLASIVRRLDEDVPSGRHVRLAGSIDNPLVGGRYSIDCWIYRDGHQGELGLQGIRLLSFVVFGTAPRHGLVALESDIVPTLEEGPA